MAENGLETGSMDIVNTVTINGKDLVMEALNVGNGNGTNWESANLNVSYGGIALSSGDSILGGTYKDGKIDYGFWGGTLDLNKSVTTFEIEKNWFVRGVETIAGVAISIVGVLFDPIIQFTSVL